MLHYQRSYVVGRVAFTVLEVVGWIAVLGGALVAAVGLVTGGVLGTLAGQGMRSPIEFIVVRIIAILPGLGVMGVGLFAVAMVQSARATVDTAEMTRDMLRLMMAREAALSGPLDLPVEDQGMGRSQHPAHRGLQVASIALPALLLVIIVGSALYFMSGK